jgi:hypothetical protein
LLERRVPRADDPDGDVTGRIGDNDTVPVVIGLFDTELDADPVPVCDTAPDAVHGARSFQQSFAAPKAKSNPNPTTTTTAKPHTYATAATAANPHAYATATATAKPDSQPMPNVFTGRSPDTAGSDVDPSGDGSGCRAELHAQQTGDCHVLDRGKNSDHDDDRHLRWHILDQLHRGIAPWYRHSDRH